MDSEISATEQTDFDYDLYDNVKLMATVMYIIIFVVGMLGNCSVFLTIACNRCMRQGKKAPNILLAGLALSDCIYLMVNTPFRISEKMFHEDIGRISKFMCGLSWSFGVFSQAISVFSLAILSCDRYKAILSPFQHRQWQTAKVYYSTVAITWGLGIVFAVAAGSLSHYSDFRLNGSDYRYKFCEQTDAGTTQAKLFEVNKAAFLFFIPMIIIAFCYINISHHLCSTGMMVKNETENTKVKQQRMRLAAIIASMAVAFFVCWLPYTMWLLLHQFGYKEWSFGNTIAWTVVPVFACANSCINPVIIYIISREFRNYICGFKIGRTSAATQSVASSTRFARLSRGSTLVTSWRFLTGRNKSINCEEKEQFQMNGLLKTNT